jgi:hypothetical protein
MIGGETPTRQKQSPHESKHLSTNPIERSGGECEESVQVSQRVCLTNGNDRRQWEFALQGGFRITRSNLRRRVIVFFSKMHLCRMASEVQEQLLCEVEEFAKGLT